MESTLPEISHLLNSNSIQGNIESSALGAEQQQPLTYFNENDPLNSVILFGNNDLGFAELVDKAMKSEPCIENWCSENFGRISSYGNGIEFEKSCEIARTASCPPPAATNGGEGKAVTLRSGTGREISFKKRKADSPTTVAEQKPLEKKMKAEMEKENGSNKGAINNQKGHLKENSKDSDAAKGDYIHVRARRGQATDSHSLAERVRREKISAKMKYLQNLVPGCNRITGKAGMLDEIINYVQSLQRQVEFLSMKLAAISPILDSGVENYLTKEMLSACGYSIPTMGASLLGQEASSSGLEMCVNSLDMTLRRTISAPVYVPEPALGTSCLDKIQHFVTDAELQNLYATDLQGRSAQCIFDQQFTGQVKLEEM